ncbi:MAG TPA: CoB--CoM heterodisulfide reductase iron-sulfur subunit B family protein, partial [Syntrophorhabdaceae bacterium]|nr:CoB--CoM heterodisulfide reductase iron-sulfur subunit B family protein [Syntrophorhabdaceae bacterium]
ETRYAHFCGCSLEGTAKEYDDSLKVVMKALGVELIEPDDWSCCGSTPAHTVDHVFAAALAARNLAIVEKMGLTTITTPCPSCLMAFKKANHNMADEAFKDEVNELLDEPYNCGVEAKSSLQVIYEDIGLDAIAARVTHILPDLKAVPYYGCILNRPPDIARFDDPENPTAMDKLLAALGVEVRDFAFKTECCGAAFSMPKREMVNELTYKVLLMAVEAGANCVVVACPLCQQNLDLRQGQVNSLMKSNFKLPVLYFTQVMGLAYGYSPKELGLDKIFVSADHVIRRVTKKEFEVEKAAEEAAKKASKTKAKGASEETKPEET